MSNATQTQDLATTILELTAAGKFDELELLWTEQLENLPAKSAFFKQWLAAMKKARELEKAEELITPVIEDKLEKGKIKFALRTLILALSVRPHAESLRPLLVRTLRETYQSIPQCDEILTLSELEADVRLTEGLNTFLALIRQTPGQVYTHYEWGTGVVESTDLTAKKTVIAFDNGGTRELTLDGVRKFLKYVEPEKFMARKVREPEKLLALAEESPCELVKLVIVDQPGRTCKQTELKALLLDGLFSTKLWNSWWPTAREALKLDPFIEFEAAGGAHATLTLRDKPKSYDQEIEERFFAPSSTLAEQGEVLQELAKRPKDNTISNDLAARMSNLLHREQSELEDEDVALKLEIAFMLDDLRAVCPEAEVETESYGTYLEEIKTYDQLLKMNQVEYQMKTLEMLCERDGEQGRELAVILLPKAPLKLAQMIWRMADQDHDYASIVSGINRLLEDPLGNVETYGWIAKNLLDGTWESFDEDFPAASVVPEMIDNLEQWYRITADSSQPRSRVAEAKAAMTKARAILSANKYDAICRALEELSLEGANRLLHSVEINDGLSSSFKAEAERYMRMTRKDLVQHAVVDDEDAESIMLTTGKAHHDTTIELRDIKSVRLPKVTKAIEEARAEGDLKENAGYQYAKEEQRLLNQRSMTLQQQLSSTRIMTSKDVDPAKVSFGTRVMVHNLDQNEKTEYTILGRWEADPERNILSHEAPMPTQMLGKRVGEEFVINFPGGGSANFKILTIENALADGSWDAPA